MTAGSIYNPSVLTVTLLAILGYVTVFPLLRNLRQRDDSLEPIVLFGGLFFLYYVVGGVGVAVLQLEPAFPAMRNYSYRLLPEFTLALGVILTGVLAFYTGYWKPTFKSAAVPTIKDRELLLQPLLVIWGISLVSYLAMMLGIVNANMLVYLVSRWHFYAIFAIAVLYYAEDSRVQTRWPILLLMAIEIAIGGLIRFEMDQLLVLLILLALAYHYAGPGIQIKHGLALGATVGILFPLSELAQELQAGAGLTEALQLSNYAGGIFTLIHPITKRMIGMDALTMIIARTPEPVPYQYGATIFNMVYSMVPRVLWPSKPTVVLCSQNNLYFSGRGADSPTCAAMTLPGELYWNFGWAGVILGLLIFGVIVRAAYEWFQRQQNVSTTAFVPLLIYGVVLVNLMRIENGTARIFSRTIKELVFTGVFLVLVTRPAGSSWGSIQGTALEKSRAFTVVRRGWMAVEPVLDTLRVAARHSKTIKGIRSVRSLSMTSEDTTSWREHSVLVRSWKYSTTRKVCARFQEGCKRVQGHPAVQNSKAAKMAKKLLP